MTFKNQIIGCMRFSYPAKEGFSVSQMEPEALETLLYEPERLRKRFAYLETITLPSLAGQTDRDFTLVILAGATMPMRFKNRLRALEETYPFLRTVFFPRMGALGAAKRAFRRGLSEDATHVTGFRIDDDDAVSVDYIARTREISDKVIAGGLADRPYIVAFSKGVYWDMNSAKRPFHEFREAQPLGLACAMITTAELDTCIYRYNHRRLACHVPTYMDPEGFMFLRTLHQHNDSGRKIPPHAQKMDLTKGLRLLETRFALDVEAAMSLMPERPA
jgi:hypothetical protein